MGVGSASNIARLIIGRLPKKFEFRRMVFNGKSISNSHYESELHGLLVTMYDREMNLNMYSLSQIFEHARVFAFASDDKKFLSNGERAIFDIDTSETMFFFIAGHYNISPELYTSTNRFNSALKIKLIDQLVGLGRSTLHFRTTMLDTSSVKALAYLDYTCCYVNSKTRKAEPLPDWFRATFESCTEVREKFQPQPLPVNRAFSWQRTLVSSDIDLNQHTNHAIYVRLCFDCGSLAIQNKRLRHFNRNDLSQYRVKSFDVAYNRESLQGDTLTVYVWEDDVSVGVLHFQINRDTDHAFYGRASFLEFPESKL